MLTRHKRDFSWWFEKEESPDTASQMVFGGAVLVLRGDGDACLTIRSVQGPLSRLTITVGKGSFGSDDSASVKSYFCSVDSGF
ncbi:Hypothetical protein NTJ_05527 [Nesidiocoris tenuis]|uniref:Laminin G domain-containing protein n=1 Tax=Nesidiocoris tenuis TaxID=355587 RepID=A0ABN7AKY6_9HEMI|nr:Hypothetical protein NTJ_05527 [Nesidiocoris tenuis]